MKMLFTLFVLSSLPKLGTPSIISETSIQANIESVSTVPRIFTGESVHLKCNIQDSFYDHVWDYRWYKDQEQLPRTASDFILQNVKVEDGGMYTCQGVKITGVHKIYTQMSLPEEIIVEGGMVILQLPSGHGLVGEDMTLTCRVRGDPPIDHIILFKEGTEVLRVRDGGQHFHLTNIALKDQGMYHCQASWNEEANFHSAISVTVNLEILEVISQPVLALNNSLTIKRMMLTCHTQYNARPPAHPIIFFFYRDNQRLGPATSTQHTFVNELKGEYKCMANVLKLGLSRWSEPLRFVKPRRRRP